MEFERIGKNTIQCHVSVEEMDEYGLRIEDFFTNQEKSRDFLEQLVEHAEEEVGYEVEGGMVSMQLMRLPDDSLVITFSEKGGDDSFHNMLSQLQNLAGILEESGLREYSEDSLEEISATEEELIEENDSLQGQDKRTAQKQKKKKNEERKSSLRPKLFCFGSLDAVEEFAVSIELQKSIPSRLYKDTKTNLYYLLLKKGKLRLEEYQMLCEGVLEYARYQIRQPYAEQYCKEHFQCMIAKHALRTLKDYQLGA